MRTIAIVGLLLTGCYSPIPQAQTSLVPVTVQNSSVDAGVDAGIRVPAAPITTVVDALMTNPQAATSEDEPFVSSCRGDDFVKNVARPAGCTGTCLFAVRPDRSAVVLDDSGEGFSVISANAQRVAWVRQSGRSRSVMVSDKADGLPRQIVSGLSSSALVVFDGDDVLLVESVAGERGNTRIVRYPAGQPESMRRVVLEATGQVTDERRVAIDAAGRVWVVTSEGGLWRSAPRDVVSGGAQVPLVNGPNGGRVNAFALLPSGLALVAIENEVWLSDGAARLDHLATLPSSVQALAPFGNGFVAIAASQLFVLEGAGPIRRILARNPASPYLTTEAALVVSGRRVLISTLCLSWSSYPGYDTAVVDLDTGTARWWWQVYASQFDVPAFPVSRANVGSNTWSSIELRRSSVGFVTTQLP